MFGWKLLPGGSQWGLVYKGQVASAYGELDLIHLLKPLFLINLHCAHPTGQPGVIQSPSFGLGFLICLVGGEIRDVLDLSAQPNLATYPFSVISLLSEFGHVIKASVLFL